MNEKDILKELRKSMIINKEDPIHRINELEYRIEMLFNDFREEFPNTTSTELIRVLLLFTQRINYADLKYLVDGEEEDK